MYELKPYRKNNTVAAYDPFRELEEFERNFFGRPYGAMSGAFSECKTDISDQGDHFLVETDLPGFDKKDISLDLNGDTLTIRAERHLEHESEDKKQKYIRTERSYGAYSRAFDVSAVNTEAIKAKYEDGVLKVTLPKKENVVPASRQLEIE